VIILKIKYQVNKSGDMFRQMKNIDTAFRQIRTFTILIVIGSISLCCFVTFKSYQLASATQGRIYILANGKALEAFAAERKDNIPVEARDHIRTFHRLFFTLDPDDKVIQSNISNALYLADASAKKQYEGLKENGYYSGIIAGNISQQISVDSITLNTEGYPYYFRCYSTQKIIRPTTIVERSLITEGYLRNVSRSDNNPHGFLIERWTTIENRDVNSQNR
jgi:conjugative transposon TraK protein